MQAKPLVTKTISGPATSRPTWPALWRGLQSQVLWLAFGLGAGLVLRMGPFGRFPLREDEALYAYWARLISSGQDPMLERVAVDKPPFFLYSLAHLFEWFGPSETVGRWLNIGCSLLALLLLWALARRLYSASVARWALALFALSPFAISFAPTLYTDPMLVAWLLLALLCAAYGFGLGAGLALGMAFATKQNALLFLPLVVGVLVLAAPTRTLFRLRQMLARPRFLRPAWALRVLTFALGFYTIWYKVWQWDGWRILPAEIPNFWEQSWHSYGGLNWVPPDQWGARLGAWWGVWRWLGGWMPGTMALALLALVAVLSALTLLHHPAHTVFARPRRQTAPETWDLLIALFVLGFLALHFFLSFQPWDRYLLGLAPLLALLGGRGLWVGYGKLAGFPRARVLVTILLVVVLGWGAWLAASARIPVGGDHGAYTGIRQVASYLQAHVPEQRGVLYHRWLGWHWNWYLWDGPRGRVYWADPAMLVADIQKHPEGYSRYIVFPGWRLDEKDAVEAALKQVGFGMQQRLLVRLADSGEIRFVVYQITPGVTP